MIPEDNLHSTAPSIAWIVSAQCPRCTAPLVLRCDDAYRHFVACLHYPRCRFSSAYAQLVHALLDRIIVLQDTLEDLGYPVERSLP
jgi:ssDNA-binding Zn-finger/Zn-ribbon topoisomerase 1